jgi:hypothetical protein
MSIPIADSPLTGPYPVDSPFSTTKTRQTNNLSWMTLTKAHRANSLPLTTLTTKTHQAKSLPSTTLTTTTRQTNNLSSMTLATKTHRTNSLPLKTTKTHQADSLHSTTGILCSEPEQSQALDAWQAEESFGPLKDSVMQPPNQIYHCQHTKGIIYLWSGGAFWRIASQQLHSFFHQFIVGAAFPAQILHVVPIAEALGELEQLRYKCIPQSYLEDVCKLQHDLRDLLRAQIFRILQASMERCRLLLSSDCRREYAVSVLGLLVGEDCCVETFPQDMSVWQVRSGGLKRLPVRLLGVKQQANDIMMVFHGPAEEGHESTAILVQAVVDVKDSDSLGEAGIHFNQGCHNDIDFLDRGLCCFL